MYKVKAIKLFGDGKCLYNEGEVFEKDKKWVDMINSTSNAPLVEVLSKSEKKESPDKGAEANGRINSTRSSKGQTRNKNNS